MNLTLLEEECSDAARLAGFALYRLSNQVPPDAWRPSLSEEQRQTAQRLAGRSHPESDWADENMDYEDQVKAVLSILARDAAAERRQHFVEAFWQVTHDPREMNSFLDALGFPVSSLPNEIQVELAGAEDSDDLPP